MQGLKRLTKGLNNSPKPIKHFVTVLLITVSFLGCGKEKSTGTGLDVDAQFVSQTFKASIKKKPEAAQLPMPVGRCQNPIPTDTKEFPPVDKPEAPAATAAASEGNNNQPAPPATAPSTKVSVFERRAKEGDKGSYELFGISVYVITKNDNSSLTVRYDGFERDEAKEKEKDAAAKSSGWKNEVVCNGLAMNVELGLHVQIPDVIHADGSVDTDRAYDIVMTNQGPKTRNQSKVPRAEGEKIRPGTIELSDLDKSNTASNKKDAQFKSQVYAREGNSGKPELIEVRQTFEGKMGKNDVLVSYAGVYRWSAQSAKEEEKE